MNLLGQLKTTKELIPTIGRSISCHYEQLTYRCPNGKNRRDGIVTDSERLRHDAIDSIQTVRLDVHYLRPQSRSLEHRLPEADVFLSTGSQQYLELSSIHW